MDVLGVEKSPRTPYIKDKAEHYWIEFEKLDRLDKKRSWNWCGFFVGPLWMAYRKMYKKAAIVTLLIIICHSVSDFMESDTCPLPDMFAMAISWLFLLCSLAIYVLVALYGNYIYKCRIDNLVAEGEHLEDALKKQHQEKYGGVSAGATVICIIVYSVIKNAISTLFL